MKKNYIFNLLLMFSVYFLNAQTIVSTDSENRKAIVEELTGIHCWACPEGHAIVKDAEAQYPGQVFAIKAHSGGFAWDCSTTGGYNFSVTGVSGAGSEYEALMQNGGAYPAASVNRQTFTGLPHYVNGGTALSRSGWMQAIENVLGQSAYVNVATHAELNGSVMNILVEGYYTGDSPESTNYLHVVILQDETHGPQFSASGNPDYIVSYEINPTYGHATETEELEYRHMDREIARMTTFAGDPIYDTSNGTFISKSYSYFVPELYNDVPVDINELKVVAFITETNQDIVNGNGSDMIVGETFGNDIVLTSLSLEDPILASSNNQLGVTVFNNGSSEITSFNISYQLDNGDIITEEFNGSIGPGESYEFVFSSTPEFIFSNDSVEVSISVDFEDDNTSNNTISQTFSLSAFCEPSMDCSFNDGFQFVQIGDIENVSGCEGYGNFTDLSTDLELGSTNQLTLTTGYGNQNVKVWIDYNDDMAWSNDELVVDNYVMAVGSAGGSFTESIAISIPVDAPVGEHVMRIKSNWNAGVPADSCELTQYGETEDYTVNIVESLGLLEIDDSLIKIYPNPSKGLFNARISGESLNFEILNILGQKIMNGVFEVGNNEINITNQQDGIYMMKLTAPNGQTKNYKLIKE